VMVKTLQNERSLACTRFLEILYHASRREHGRQRACSATTLPDSLNDFPFL
jgi:hypothetical protein